MSKSISPSEVSAHNTVDTGLYIIIDSSVFNITGFINEHPGGQKILKRVGGKDASKQFWKVSEVLNFGCRNHEGIGYMCWMMEEERIFHEHDGAKRVYGMTGCSCVNDKGNEEIRRPKVSWRASSELSSGRNGYDVIGGSMECERQETR